MNLLETPGHLTLPAPTIICHHLRPSVLPHHHLPSTAIIAITHYYCHHPPSSIIFHHLLLFPTNFYHHPASSAITHASSAITHHHLPSATLLSPISKNFIWTDVTQQFFTLEVLLEHLLNFRNSC